MTAPAVPIDRARPIPPDPQLIVKLDRLGFLLEEHKRHKPWLDELEKLKKEVRAHCFEMDANAPVRLEGGAFYIDLSMKENERRVENKPKAFGALRKAMGLEKLIEALTFTLKLIDEWVPAKHQSPFVVQERTGSRDLSAVRKEGPKAA